MERIPKWLRVVLALLFIAAIVIAIWVVFIGKKDTGSPQTVINTEPTLLPPQQLPPASTNVAIDPFSGVSTTVQVPAGEAQPVQPAQQDASQSLGNRQGCMSEAPGVSPYTGRPYSDYVMPPGWITPNGYQCNLSGGVYYWYSGGVPISAATWKWGIPYPNPATNPAAWQY